MCHQLQNLLFIHRSLLSSLNIHISHYLPEIATLIAYRYLKCSMLKTESSAAPPSFNFFFWINGISIHPGVQYRNLVVIQDLLLSMTSPIQFINILIILLKNMT